MQSRKPQGCSGWGPGGLLRTPAEAGQGTPRSCAGRNFHCHTFWPGSHHWSPALSPGTSWQSPYGNSSPGGSQEKDTSLVMGTPY